MPHRTSKNEEDYFTREDWEKRHKLHVQHEKEIEQQHKEELKRLHFGKCPRCGNDLEHASYKLVEAEHCLTCDTLTLSKSDLEKLCLAGHSMYNALLEAFAKK